MNVLKIIVITLALLLVRTGAIAQQPPGCDDGASIRKFIGPRPLTHVLWNILKGTKVPLWARHQFHEQQFCYLGRMDKEPHLQLVNFTTMWGQSCRATKRLLVFDSKNRFLGMYSDLAPEIRNFDGGVLLHENGRVDFTNGPPSKIENSTYETAQTILQGY